MTRMTAALLLLLGLTGCGTSAPVRYHALAGRAVPLDETQASAALLVEVLPVAIPERINREEIVLTGKDGRLDIRDGERCRRIKAIVFSRHGKLRNFRQICGVDGNLVLTLRKKLVESILQIGKVLIIIQVIFLDIRNHSDVRMKIQQMPHIFVGLDDQILALARLEIAAEFFHERADDNSRVEPR